MGHVDSGRRCPKDIARTEIARSDKRTRALVTQQIRDNIELLATLIHDANEKNKRGARSQAILTYCALLGAIGVARAVSDDQLSREILNTLAVRLKGRTRAAPVPGERLDFLRKVASGKTIALEHDVLSLRLNSHPPVLQRSAIHSGNAKWVAATQE
jgi:hypothetical protein